MSQGTDDFELWIAIFANEEINQAVEILGEVGVVSGIPSVHC